MKNPFLLFVLLFGFFGRAQYTAIPDVNFEQALVDLGIDSAPVDGKVLTANVSGITTLDVSKKVITNLSGIQDFTSLKQLLCYYNQLTSLDVTKNTALISLVCNQNRLTSLDVTKNTSLTSLDCSTNQLTSLNISKNTGLTSLSCRSNQFTSLDVTKNTALTRLDCTDNQLSNLDITKNNLLINLNCPSNQLTSLDVTNNTALIFLYCDHNYLTNLDVTKNTALTSINCSSNKLTNLEISKNTVLTSFFCYSNQLTNLDVSKNTLLNVLNCSDNKITVLDVSTNTNLSTIDCASNNLTFLNLKNGNNTKILSPYFKSNPNLSCIQVDNKSYSDTNWSSKNDATSSFSENCSKTAANISPIVTASGNQIYCPQTNQKIVTAFDIVDPDDTSAAAIYVQISSGYVNGQDLLTLANPALHPTIKTVWDVAAGKLTLSSPTTGTAVSYLDFIAAIKDIEFSNSSATPSGIRSFSITLGEANFLPSTGHYYQYVPNTGITWTNAKTAAEASTYYGLKGYLATLLSADEAKLSGEQASGAGWIGGSDAETEGTWKWVTGPEAGTIFWNGLANGTTPNFAYWNNTSTNKEPNQSGDEDYAHITAPGVGLPGSWNDLSNTGNLNPGNAYQPKGYIVEYGGMPGDPILQISASTKITIPKITSTTPASRCDSGSLTLQATASDGVMNWYDLPTGGTSLHTGNSFTTTNLASTTTYYVDASNGSCPNARTPITATINITPSITSTTPANRCDSGSVTLGAVASSGTINWYDALTGGTLLATGNSFTTPNLASTTTYYVDAIASECTTPTRTPITATINVSPTITATTPAFLCDSGIATLGATASAGTINWHDAQTGGTLLGTGISFTTPNLTATTTYYVDATANGCTSPTRTAIVATVNISPSITATPNSRCDSGTVTLGATASAGTINWHDAPTGGTLLATGNSFTTPSLATTTTYYVDATASGCTTPTRTPITATINTTPTITSTTPESRCDSGTVTLGASASAGTINWYDVQTGGTSLGTGTSFTTPSLTSTTTFYVDATATGCTSPRQAVVATIYPISSLNEEIVLCQSETVTLDASIPGMNYLWTPNGETSQTIVVSSIGDYSVTISSPLASCDSKKSFKVIEHPKPVIKEIVVTENSATIELENPEIYYEFSIDGMLFTDSNLFLRIPSGQYTAFVREKNGCNLTQRDFSIFSISKYFTPNNDGFNDVFEIKEMKDFPHSSLSIFNRYGKLLKQLNYGNSGWNGTFNGLELPADDYWYVLKLEDSKPEIKGHFSLKR